jgi:hypothetical protein
VAAAPRPGHAARPWLKTPPGLKQRPPLLLLLLLLLLLVVVVLPLLPLLLLPAAAAATTTAVAMPGFAVPVCSAPPRPEPGCAASSARTHGGSMAARSSTATHAARASSS